MSASDRLQDGQPFGRYQIVRLLGEGGMGAVYEAIHPVLKKRFAIKTLLPSIAEHPEARARFLREGEAASRINHPNVVDVTDVGTEAGVPYLVMEYLDGQTLGDLMSSRGRMDVKQAVDVLLPVASAVAAGHDHGVVHRDLKPQNIFLAYGPWGEPVPKVLDFGVSKLVGEGDSANLTGTMAFLGTAAYMSPEQARGARRVDGQSDQYALGLIFYEMLTGARAHPGEHPLEVLHNVTSGAIVPPGQLRPDLPEPLVAALMRMLAGTPTDRHPSLRAVGRALMPFASERVRLAMADAFRETALDSALPSSSSSSSSSPLAGGTQMLPQPNTQPSTRPDRPSRKVDTTLGQTASEVAPPVAGRPPRRGIAIGVVSAVAAVAIGAFVLVGRKSPAPEHAPAAATAPPAVAPAAVAPAPPPIPAPPPPPVTAPEPPPAAPDDAPAKVAEPSADKPKKASHGTKTSHATPRPAASPAAAAAKPDCDPNFYLDAQGEKHFKPECFLKR